MSDLLSHTGELSLGILLIILFIMMLADWRYNAS